VGQDGGDAGADRVTLDAGDLPHAYARHVGDGVVRPGREPPRRDAEVAGANPLLGSESERGGEQQ
jgi:hypothetical protein